MRREGVRPVPEKRLRLRAGDFDWRRQRAERGPRERRFLPEILHPMGGHILQCVSLQPVYRAGGGGLPGRRGGGHLWGHR